MNISTPESITKFCYELDSVMATAPQLSIDRCSSRTHIFLALPPNRNQSSTSAAPNFSAICRNSIIRSSHNINEGEVAERIGEDPVTRYVDYNKGRRRVYVRVEGAGKDKLPARYRLRAAGSADWTVTEVVERILRLEHWEDIEGVLNGWAGRFARKNFPLLVQVLSLFHCLHVELFFFAVVVLLQ